MHNGRVAGSPIPERGAYAQDDSPSRPGRCLHGDVAGARVDGRWWKQPASDAVQLAGSLEQRQPEDAPAEAEKWYGDAYDEVAKAKKDMADGKKQRNLDKRWKKASDKAERAVEYDPTYHEAWNLVGCCARQLKDYDKSLNAYNKCLEIKPDYAPAREYLGEACVEQGKLPQAREQLAMLEKLNASDEASRLKTAIDAYVSGAPRLPRHPRPLRRPRPYPRPPRRPIHRAASPRPHSRPL